MNQIHTAREQRFLDMAGEMADDFAKRAAIHDEEGSFPFENYERLKESGYTRLIIPESLIQRERQQRLDVHRVADFVIPTQLKSGVGLNRNFDEILERIVDADCQLLIGHGARRRRGGRGLLRLRRSHAQQQAQ